MTTSQKPTNEVYYASIVLIALIYATAIWTFNEIRLFATIFNFNDEFFKCRQPALHITYVIAFCFVLYILHPVTLLLSNIYGMDSSIPLLINDVSDILIFLTFFPRAWILWFDRAFIDNLKNWVWRRELNPQDANFLVKYRKYFTNSHALVYSVYLVLVAPIFITLHVLPYFKIGHLQCHIVSTVLLVVMLVATIKIVLKISIVSDEFSIRPELLASVKSTGIMYIIAHIMADLALMGHPNWALFVDVFCISLADLSVIYYTCRWTRNQYVFFQKVRYMNHVKQNGLRASFCSFNSHFSRRIQFQDIMEHRHGVEAFCNHLTSEFGLESILFLLEVTQFKAIIKRLSDGTIEDNVPSLCDWNATNAHERALQLTQKPDKKPYIFSADVILDVHWLPIDPRMYCQSAYQIALHLYDKYVEESADLCINISFENRRAIYRYFQHLSQVTHQHDSVDGMTSLLKDGEDNDVENGGLSAFDLNNPLVKVYKVFDNAFKEIWFLIKTDSFLRFMGTEEFRRLIDALYPDEAKYARKQLIKSIDEEIDRKRQLRQQSVNTTEEYREFQGATVELPHKTRGLSLEALKNVPSLIAGNSSDKRKKAKMGGMNNDFHTALTEHSQHLYLPEHDQLAPEHIKNGKLPLDDNASAETPPLDEDPNAEHHVVDIEVGAQAIGRGSSLRRSKIPKLHYQQNSMPSTSKYSIKKTASTRNIRLAPRITPLRHANSVPQKSWNYHDHLESIGRGDLPDGLSLGRVYSRSSISNPPPNGSAMNNAADHDDDIDND